MEIAQIESLLRIYDKKTESQAGQDLFVLAMTEFKSAGTFLEIGCGHPIHHNNTYLLEKSFDWSGYAIDRQTAYEHLYHAVKKAHWPDHPAPFDCLPEYVQMESVTEKLGLSRDYYDSSDWTHRPNSVFVKTDAMQIDYSTFPDYFDYLQIDLDNPLDGLEILDILTATKKFGTITFEHDIFTESVPSIRAQSESRLLLKSLGYQLLANDVTVEPGKGWAIDNRPILFEDWWIHPDIVSDRVSQYFLSIGDGTSAKYYTDILFKSGAVFCTN